MFNAILTALRYRAISEPHDRTFSLLAILDALGIQTEKPSYRLPVGQTNAQFIGSLLSWNPGAVSLILDVGSQHETGGPTWAPDWSRVPPSWWLTSRYRNGDFSRYLPTNVMVEGNKLRLDAVCLGKVLFQTIIFDTRTGHNTEEDIESRLSAAYHVFRQVITTNEPNEELVSSVFSVLEGIAPARQATSVFKLDPPPVSDRPRNIRLHRRTIEVPELLVKAPYDFTDRPVLFEQFRCLHNVMIGAAEERYKPKPAISPQVYLRTISTSFARDNRGLFAMTLALKGNENGGMIGSGPLEVEVGDEVFFIPSVPTPMVLRRGQSGNLRVIGAALIHGTYDEEDRRRIPLDHVEEVILV
ncbi:Fc.00g097710.m01.CDS01 [Cosmosporella sp. VM-42]